jgi:hypothetical protein
MAYPSNKQKQPIVGYQKTGDATSDLVLSMTPTLNDPNVTCVGVGLDRPAPPQAPQIKPAATAELSKKISNS